MPNSIIQIKKNNQLIEVAGASVGVFATSSALQAAFPAASHPGKVGLVGSVAPYGQYISNGQSWSQMAGEGYVGPFANMASLQASFPAANNAGKIGLVGTTAPYITYVSDGSTWLERYVPNQSLSSGVAFTPSTFFRIVLTAQANSTAYLYGYNLNEEETLHKMSYIMAGDTETWIRDVGNDVTFRVVFNPLEISASLYR